MASPKALVRDFIEADSPANRSLRYTLGTHDGGTLGSATGTSGHDG